MRLERQFRALAMKLLPRERIVLFGGARSGRSGALTSGRIAGNFARINPLHGDLSSLIFDVSSRAYAN